MSGSDLVLNIQNFPVSDLEFKFERMNSLERIKISLKFGHKNFYQANQDNVYAFIDFQLFRPK